MASKYILLTGITALAMLVLLMHSSVMVTGITALSFIIFIFFIMKKVNSKFSI